MPWDCARSDRTDDVTIAMKPQPEPSAQEVLAGLVERVTYHNAENGFCVLRAKARGHRDIVTVVGYSATEATGLEAKTIHRLLEVDPKGGALNAATTTRSTVIF